MLMNSSTMLTLEPSTYPCIREPSPSWPPGLPTVRSDHFRAGFIRPLGHDHVNELFNDADIGALDISLHQGTKPFLAAGIAYRQIGPLSSWLHKTAGPRSC